MCLSIVGLLRKEILQRKSFLKKTAISKESQRIFNQKFSNHISSKQRSFAHLLLQNSRAGDYLTRDILLNLPAQETHHRLLSTSRIFSLNVSSSVILSASIQAHQRSTIRKIKITMFQNKKMIQFLRLFIFCLQSSFGSFKSTGSLKRAITPFSCFSFSSIKEEDDDSLEKQREKQKEEEQKQKDLKLLDEIVILNPFKFSKNPNFMEIRCSNCFNDRTEVIAELAICEYILLFHPRGSGKSTSLNTISTFLEKKVNEKGEKDEIYLKKAEAMFFGGEIEIEDKKVLRFDPLKIANMKIKGNNSKQYFGRYPCLFFNFNALASAKTEDELIERLNNQINDQFNKHQYVFDSMNLSAQEYFNFFKDASKRILLNEKLLYLCQVLFHHHNEQIAVFIDEFDSLFNRLLGEDQPDYELLNRASRILTKFLEVLSKQVGGISVRYVVVGGVYNNLLKEVAGPNNFTEISVNSILSMWDIGLHQEEVEKYIKNMLDPKQSQYEEKLNLLIKTIHFQYKRYDITGQIYYNIWSVYNYLQNISDCYQSQQAISNVRFNYFWETNSNTVIIRILRECRNINIKLKLLSIGLGQSQHLWFSTYEDLTKPINQMYERQLEMYASSILFYGGYVTKDISNKGNFVIPNEDLRTLFWKFIPDFINYGKGNIREQLCEGIVNLEREKIQNALSLYCFEYLSSKQYQHFDVSETDCSGIELQYVNVVRTLLLDMLSHYEMQVEQESKHGYADIILKPTQNSEKLTFIEVKSLSSKTTQSKTNLKKLAEKAIAQIKNIDSTADDLISNLNYCVLIGITFHNKSVKVEFEFQGLKQEETSANKYKFQEFFISDQITGFEIIKYKPQNTHFKMI